MKRVPWSVWAVVAVVLLAAAGWLLSAGTDGLAYQREWPTMSDGTVARTQFAFGVLLVVACLAAGRLALRARRRS